ncbi:MAG: hypothetical protein FJX65_02465 [Alphaproteobacteria bacterium]|nr:hypothetical protein [Alphaproteobacteria bacterium]
MEWRDIRRAHARLFPERQFILRSEGRVRYFVLSRRLQTCVATVALVIGGWMLFSTLYFLAGEARLAIRETLIADLSTTNRNLEWELRSSKSRFASATAELESKHRQLVDLLSHKDVIEQRISSLSAQVETVTEEHRDATDEVQRLRRELEDQREKILQRLGAGTTRSGQNDQRSSLDHDVDETRARLAAVRNERDVLARLQPKPGPGIDVDRVTDRLSAVRREQVQLLEQILGRTERDIRDLESTIARTGIKPERLIAAANRSLGMGGPLLALRGAPDQAPATEPQEFEDDPEFDGQLSALEERLRRWEALQDLFLVLPLATPLESAYVSSEFGYRRDPFTNRPAFHAGADFSGPSGQLVWTTAPGRVTFVGRNGPFGKMVEIDHGLGLTSRYAHLSRTSVEVGQQIGLREEIGRMGSTGRSTGAHLHYEIRFNGTALDPVHFIRVGNHLRRAQGAPRTVEVGNHVLKK